MTGHAIDNLKKNHQALSSMVFYLSAAFYPISFVVET
jgi:hypothetical protein